MKITSLLVGGLFALTSLSALAKGPLTRAQRATVRAEIRNDFKQFSQTLPSKPDRPTLNVTFSKAHDGAVAIAHAEIRSMQSGGARMPGTPIMYRRPAFKATFAVEKGRGGKLGVTPERGANWSRIWLARPLSR